ELALLVGQVVGVGLGRVLRVGRLVRRLLGVVGDIPLGLGQLLELLLGVFEGLDVLAPLLDRRGLLVQRVLGLLEFLQRLLLVGLGRGRVLLGQVVVGLLLGLGGLVERLLGLRVGRQRGVPQLVGLVRHVLLGGGGFRKLLGVLHRLLGLVPGGLLLLDELFEPLGGVLDRRERVLLGQFGLGDLLVEFVLGLLEVVDRLLLRVAGGPRVVLAEVLLGPGLLLDRLVDGLGHVRGDGLGGDAGVAGVELGLGLFGGEFLVLLGLGRLGLLVRGLLVHLGLGLDRLGDLVAGLLEGLDPVGRRPAEGG